MGLSHGFDFGVSALTAGAIRHLFSYFKENMDKNFVRELLAEMKKIRDQAQGHVSDSVLEEFDNKIKMLEMKIDKQFEEIRKAELLQLLGIFIGAFEVVEKLIELLTRR